MLAKGLLLLILQGFVQGLRPTLMMERAVMFQFKDNDGNKNALFFFSFEVIDLKNSTHGSPGSQFKDSAFGRRC